MTFKPNSGKISIEHILDHERDEWTFSDKDKQWILGDALRLVLGVSGEDPTLPWPPLAWGQEELFPSTVNSIQSRWHHDIDGASGEFTFDSDTTFLQFVTTGEEAYFLRQSAVDAAGQQYFTTNVDKANGYVIETRVQVDDVDTGATVAGHYLLIDDGEYRGRFNFLEDRLSFYFYDSGDSTWGYIDELSAPIDLKTEPRTLRFAVQGSTVHVLDDVGLVSTYDLPVGSSVSPTLILGAETGVTATTSFDNFKQYHHDGTSMILDAPQVPGRGYSTGFIDATTPAFSPGVPLSGWNKAVIGLEGTDAGTTQMYVQYKSYELANWIDYGETGELTGTQVEVGLDDVPVTGDATDQIRFVFEQKSEDGTGEALRVKQVAVYCGIPAGELSIYPNWGPEYGETVAIDVASDWTSSIQFPVQSNWPTDANTKLLYHFDDTATGVFLDASGNSHDGIVPVSAGKWTLQGQQGWFGYSTHAVAGNAQIQVPASTDFIVSGQDVTVSFFTKSYTTTGDSSIVWDHEVGGVGYEVRLNTSGQLEVMVDDGGTETIHTHTGALAGVNSWVACWTKILQIGDYPFDTEIRTKVSGSGWESTTGSFGDYFDGLGTSAPTMLTGCWGNFDEFVWYAGDRDEDTFDSLSLRDVRRSTFDDWAIFVDREAVTGERVNWYYPTRAYVRVPPHIPGNADIYVTGDGDIYRPGETYRYVRSYAVDVEDDLAAAQACTTKSPFRIGHSVADGDVNLALLYTPPLSVDSHMSLVGMEDLEAANLAAYGQGEFVLTQADTGAGNYTYSTVVDTNELLVSTKSVIRREFRQGRPLFFKYLIGRGRRYVYNQDAADTADANLIRAGLRIEDGNGRVVSLGDYPWDIEVSSTDIYGSTLPANAFSVVLYTEKRGVPGESIYVVYDALDARKGWGRDQGIREIINPVPIFEEVVAVDASFQYSATLDETGVYSVEISL